MARFAVVLLGYVTAGTCPAVTNITGETRPEPYERLVAMPTTKHAVPSAHFVRIATRGRTRCDHHRERDPDADFGTCGMRRSVDPEQQRADAAARAPSVVSEMEGPASLLIVAAAVALVAHAVHRTVTEDDDPHTPAGRPPAHAAARRLPDVRVAYSPARGWDVGVVQRTQ
eukprot:TRINITY_DN10584_c0_g1_i1.p3 TRINITY_DN10584_c0_g1~~TRINITY_DN10584_c0_g1_i1.p3  ORF type:complete len:200 (+),score=46.09 TRINITY_DN10584_c0_g1_i1:88-600(+)